MRMWRLGWLFVLLIPVACTTLGPDYQPPDTRWFEQWEARLHGLNEGAEKPDQDLRFWWSIFQDPVLDELMLEARRANPGLRIAALRILESRALLGMIGSSAYPQLQQLDGLAGYVGNRLQGGRGDNLGSVELAFNLAWELDFWGRFRRAIESADAAFLASVANQQNVQVLMNAQLAETYFAYRTTQARIRIARQNAAIQKRSLAIAEVRFRNGETSELDLQQATTQYLSTMSVVPQLAQQLGSLKNALAVLLGRLPGDVDDLISDEDYQLPLVTVQHLGTAAAQTLMRRPDVRAAAWVIAAQSAQIGLVQADYYPAINLLGKLTLSGSTLAGGRNALGLVLGPGFTWNIFDYGRIANNIRLQDVRLQQAIENFRNVLLNAAAELDIAALRVVKSAEQQAILDESVKTAERALSIATTSYREGYADFQRVLDAQRALAGQMDRQVANQGENLAALVSLYKALGGGWQPVGSVGDWLSEKARRQMQQRTDWGDAIDQPIPQVSSPVANHE